MPKVAINGFGRIGRAAFKVLLDDPELELVAVNDLIDPDNLLYLLRYDTVYGRFEKDISLEDGQLNMEGRKIKITSEKDPDNLPWKNMGVDLVFECTGVFRELKDCQRHLQAGAKRVVLSAPPKSEGIPIVLYGVNQPTAAEEVLSAGSCTTNCIGPVVEIMMRRVGVKKAVLNTIHAYTASQNIVDGPHKKRTRGRAAAANLVPTTTGAASATTEVVTELSNKFDGVAVRTPVAAGSISDLVFVVRQDVDVEQVNRLFAMESENERYGEVLGVSSDPLVSSDILKDPRASVVDLTQTQVIDGDLVRVMAWYDNEWGYTHQMIRTARQSLQKGQIL